VLKGASLVQKFSTELAPNFPQKTAIFWHLVLKCWIFRQTFRVGVILNKKFGDIFSTLALNLKKRQKTAIF